MTNLVRDELMNHERVKASFAFRCALVRDWCSRGGAKGSAQASTKRRSESGYKREETRQTPEPPCQREAEEEKQTESAVSLIACANQVVAATVLSAAPLRCSRLGRFK